MSDSTLNKLMTGIGINVISFVVAGFVALQFIEENIIQEKTANHQYDMYLSIAEETSHFINIYTIMYTQNHSDDDFLELGYQLNRRYNNIRQTSLYTCLSIENEDMTAIIYKHMGFVAELVERVGFAQASAIAQQIENGSTGASTFSELPLRPDSLREVVRLGSDAREVLREEGLRLFLRSSSEQVGPRAARRQGPTAESSSDCADLHLGQHS